MNNSPASNFIETVLGKNREVLLEIINNLFFEIHDLVLNEFYIPKKNEKLFEIKRKSRLSDFSSAADLFRDRFYLNKRFPPKYNHEHKRDMPQQISLIRLKNEIRHLNDELVREKIKGQIKNDYFNLNTIDQIARLVIDINTLRNREEHELDNFDFSQASLLFGYLNRLLALTPDHILDSLSDYQEYSEYLNNEFKKLTKIYIPTEDEEAKSDKNEVRPDIDIKDLAEKISEQLQKENDVKDKEIEALKDQLETKIPKTVYCYMYKKEWYEMFAKKDERGFIIAEYSADNKDQIAYEWAYRADCTQLWGGPVDAGVPNCYIPHGTAQDKDGHVYMFHDKNDPYYHPRNIGEDVIKNVMFSIEDIELSWGPFEEPLEIIRDLSVTFTDHTYTDEEWEAYSTYKGLWDKNPEDVLTPRQLELVKEIEKRPPIVIPIKDWEYPKGSSWEDYEREQENETRTEQDEQLVPQMFDIGDDEEDEDSLITKPTIETIIRKTRKETREQLLELRNKIYTIMTNHTVFDHWDNILNSKIIKNILNESIFSSEDFKTADIKPGYIWKTASKQLEEGYVKRDKESLELMDLQINQFWGEVQDITRNYFFDYDFIYNNKNKPWAKAFLRYKEKDYKENKNLYDEIFDYLNKSNSSIKKDSSPFNEFSLSFIKALKRNIDEFPNDDLTWEAIGDGYVIKKLRK